MAYDLLVKHGRIVDGSGMPAFMGDVAVRHGWRIRERAQGIAYTVVNGTVLIEHGEHTGALPGRIHRNALYA